MSQVVGILPGTVIRLRAGCGAHGVYGGMWHFRRAGKEGLTVCGMVVEMSGAGYAVWEEAALEAGMWKRVCAGCRGSLVGLRAEGGGLREAGGEEAGRRGDPRIDTKGHESVGEGAGLRQAQPAAEVGGVVQLGLFGEGEE